MFYHYIIPSPKQQLEKLITFALKPQSSCKKMTIALTSALKIAPFLPFALFSLLFLHAKSQSYQDNDYTVMFALRQSLNPPKNFGWSDPDPCKWSFVGCSRDNRVTRIQIGNNNLKGTLPSSLYLTQLERLELQGNNISGPLPTLKGLSSLQVLLLSYNQFSSIPSDFFDGMTSLQSVNIDNNPFSAWEIPESLKSASALQSFSANSARISGDVPTFFGPDAFPGLKILHLALNNMNGGLPSSFSGMQIESLWLNGQNLSGGIDVIQNMTLLNELWLHSNIFSAPLPDFSGLKGLEKLSLRDNSFTGPVPSSLVNLDSLKVVNLTNNLLQGPMPPFRTGMEVDMIKETNSFCLPQPGDCDPQVNTLLSIAKSVGYPQKFAENWKGNNPCADWLGITCNGGNITVISFVNMGLTGTISPAIASLTSLQRVVLANNNLTGTIPQELATLPALGVLDVSNNNLYGKVPAFSSSLNLKTNGNPDIGKDISPTTHGTPGSESDGSSVDTHKKSRSRIGVVIISVIGSVFVVCLIAVAAFCLYRTKQKKSSRVKSPKAIVIHPRHSISDNDNLKITVAGSGANVSVGGVSEIDAVSISGTSDIHMVEAGNMVISIQVLRNVTNNFSEENILGQGGFGIVYRGELHDGTKIAVKRMDSTVLSGKGLAEFQSEITVLTKVRHRHLVTLLGYCLDGNEKLLVYEFMPQGTLSRHLFNWANEGLKPLEWTKRLIIALDVARGVEYLHGLAQQSFIHRDLKPSNILLGDNMRAKVGDFGLVRLAPEGKGSIETKIAGTFGYLAPEYAVTGRVTTKVDVYSFGVILMEMITGRKALDERQSEESVHLVTWFRRVLLNKDTFRKAIDPVIDLDEETMASINIVAELAGHCCAREPYQRPEMAHAVNVISSLVEHWKPSDLNSEDVFGIDLGMSLPEVLQKWQNHEDTSGGIESSSYSCLPSMDNTQTSIPSRPQGFTDSFTSADGR